ncbi:hypothetical protein [Alteribacillus sp. HJP-4]|uniref:hypothetical protein n=1 Tax=Alteribacillus sp. HJP-4 TaxID=2775394 RepID=UPI0035CD3614
MEETGQSLEHRAASIIVKRFKDYFSKGPGSVYVSIKKGFFSIHIREFLTPLENFWNLNCFEVETKLNDLIAKEEKKPEGTKAYWPSDHIIVVYHYGVLGGLEKEFIKEGYTAEVKIKKRKIEKQLYDLKYLEWLLQKQVHEVFIDWIFNLDCGYNVLLIE